MKSIGDVLPGQKTYLAGGAMIVVGVIALIAPEVIPGIEPAQMIGTGAVALFLRMGIGKKSA